MTTPLHKVLYVQVSSIACISLKASQGISVKRVFNQISQRVGGGNDELWSVDLLLLLHLKHTYGQTNLRCSSIIITSALFLVCHSLSEWPDFRRDIGLPYQVARMKDASKI